MKLVYNIHFSSIDWLLSHWVNWGNFCFCYILAQQLQHFKILVYFSLDSRSSAQLATQRQWLLSTAALALHEYPSMHKLCFPLTYKYFYFDQAKQTKHFKYITSAKFKCYIMSVMMQNLYTQLHSLNNTNSKQSKPILNIC